VLKPVKETRYRLPNGQFGKKTMRGAKKEEYETLRDKRGVIRRAVAIFQEGIAIKKTERGRVEKLKGRLDAALFETNVTTKLRGAKRFEIRIEGKDSKGRRVRIKRIVDVPKRGKANSLVHETVQAMYDRGFVTHYDIQQGKKGRVLKNVTITIKVFK